jgi:hypothetical protein
VPALSVIGGQGQGDLKAFWHSGIGPAVSHAIAVGFGGALWADLGPVILTSGVVDMGPQGSALAPQGGRRRQRARVARLCAG